jgi:hypothetical protein
MIDRYAWRTLLIENHNLNAAIEKRIKTIMNIDMPTKKGCLKLSGSLFTTLKLKS